MVNIIGLVFSKSGTKKCYLDKCGKISRTQMVTLCTLRAQFALNVICLLSSYLCPYNKPI